MHSNKRIVTVTPAGRERYLRILVSYILRNKQYIDQHRFWVNTCNPTDIAYIESVVASDPEFFAADYLVDSRPDWTGNRRVRLIREFFPQCTESNTVYIRLDDDICWIKDGSIPALIEYRINHPEFFLVYPCIVNNGYVAKIHSDMNLISLPNAQSFRKWQRLPVIGAMHHQLLLDAIASGTTDVLAFDPSILGDYEQAPINCISWLGEEFAKFYGCVADKSCDFLEEVWLTQIYPKHIGKPNCIYGHAMMAHFAFNTQRKYLEEQTNLLEMYELLALRDMHDWIT